MQLDPQSPQVEVNGTTRTIGPVGGHVTLLEWLRSQGLTGSKEGCAEGECGACSVLVVRPDGEAHSRWTAINSCLVPAAGFIGQEVITAEGLGTPDALHPVQREMAVRGGSQCGYCTPGFVCSMAAEYYRPDRTPNDRSDSHHGPGSDHDPDSDQVSGVDHEHEVDHEHGPNGFDLHALSGNLCRCTGYRPIRDAAYALDQPGEDDPLRRRTEHPAPPARPITLDGDQGRFIRPPDLSTALDLLAEYPDARPVAGSTDWGVELNIRHSRAALSIGIDRLPELRRLEVDESGVLIGAALSLTEIERGLAGRVPLLDELFPQFASRLIRNGATLGGNLGTGSPIGDSPPALLALDASVILTSRDGEREVALDSYFTGYRRSVRRAGELITAVRVPLPVSRYSGFHKIAKRRFDDISSVAVALALDLDDSTEGSATVRSVRIGLGGVAATPIRATGAEHALTGRPWTRDVVREAAELLAAEGTPLDDHRASAAYRTAMLRTSLLKFRSQVEAERAGREQQGVPA